MKKLLFLALSICSLAAFAQQGRMQEKLEKVAKLLEKKANATIIENIKNTIVKIKATSFLNFSFIFLLGYLEK